MKYLLLNEKGVIDVMQTDGELFNDKGQALYRPWGIHDGRVIFSDWKKRGSYDKEESQRRRRKFETRLAQDAAKYPECYRTAVDTVTEGLKRFVGTNEESAGAAVKARCYGDTISGRLGSKSTGDMLTNREAWQQALKFLSGNDIAKILGIQTTLANFLTRKLPLQGAQLNTYNDTKVKVAPCQGCLYSWFDQEQGTELDNDRRGRKKRELPQNQRDLKPSTAAGLLKKGKSEEPRVRGIDTWTRVEGSDFVNAIDMRNLIFGAGRSGTTGELLKTYRTFGGLDDGEEFKKYLLAIVVYLVGGGHHTCHEIFSVANLLVGTNGPRTEGNYNSVATILKQVYVPGKYLKHLPTSYINTQHFTELKEQYYDIAMMGHLHGTFVN